MNAPVFWLLAALFLFGGLSLTWRLIGTLDESPALPPRPLLTRFLPDRLDRLASQYAAPDSLLPDLLRTDRFIAQADAILLIDRTLTGAGL